MRFPRSVQLIPVAEVAIYSEQVEAENVIFEPFVEHTVTQIERRDDRSVGDRTSRLLLTVANESARWINDPFNPSDSNKVPTSVVLRQGSKRPIESQYFNDLEREVI